MSRQNKVNPDHYQVAGRLTPDESARERAKQRQTRPRDIVPAERGKARSAPASPGSRNRKPGSRSA